MFVSLLILLNSLILYLITTRSLSSAFCIAGYYLATLEAATQHICDLAEQYESVAEVDVMFDNGEDIYEETLDD